MGTDTVNEPVTIRDLTFSSQLGIGAAKWLEKHCGQPIMKIAESFASMDGENLDITRIALLLTALYIQAHPRIDPAEAEAQVDTLLLPEMLDVLSRCRAFEFAPKNSPEPAPATEPSTGPTSNTT